MKLQHLAIGARFEYEGKVFVKSGPLTATCEQGGQQLIPRYAMLKPLDVAEAAPAPGVAARRLDPLKVRKAFDAFYELSRQHCDAAGQTALEAARAEFLAAIR
ncbi:MAG: hypothetical protein LWW81_08790 [Rhodocyclales bacterium]|nr:hypothetical protein [Rhodocyclales bacterium]